MNDSLKKITQLVLFLAIGAGLNALHSVLFLGIHSKVLCYNSIVTPLIGSLLSSLGVASLIGFFAIKSVWLLTSIPVTLGIPSFVATLSWSTWQNSNRFHRIIDAILHLFIPAACITAFITHPTGKHAAWYASYWLIPMILWFISLHRKRKSVVEQAVQSTFVAHATGSIIWLYADLLSAAAWNALIPVVAAERLIIALCTAIVYYTVQKISCLVLKFSFKNKLIKLLSH